MKRKKKKKIEKKGRERKVRETYIQRKRTPQK